MCAGLQGECSALTRQRADACARAPGSRMTHHTCKCSHCLLTAPSHGHPRRMQAFPSVNALLRLSCSAELPQEPPCTQVILKLSKNRREKLGLTSQQERLGGAFLPGDDWEGHGPWGGCGGARRGRGGAHAPQRGAPRGQGGWRCGRSIPLSLDAHVAFPCHAAIRICLSLQAQVR